MMACGTNCDLLNSSAASRILVVGATGYIGSFVAQAAVTACHPTYALIRPSTASDPAKAQRVRDLKDSGVHILYGSLSDHNFLVNSMKDADIVICTMGGSEITEQLKIVDAIKEVGTVKGSLSDHNFLVNSMKDVDIVISTMGGSEITEQLKIVDAIKEVGTVKRFLPSEFGHDIDKAEPVEPGLTFYNEKRKIRRAVEAANIPFTYICCNSIAGWPYFYHTHPSELPPPTEQLEIYGDGNVKAYFVTGADIGKCTIKTVDDERTLNKAVHFRPPKNFLTLNELAAIWETKIGKTLPRVCISEQELLAMAKANYFPNSIVASLTHDIFINGCQYKFEIDGHHDVEICQLYPEVVYTTVDDFFNGYL